MNMMNRESVCYYTLNDNLDIVNNKYDYLFKYGWSGNNNKFRLEKSYNNMFYRSVIE